MNTRHLVDPELLPFIDASPSWQLSTATLASVREMMEQLYGANATGAKPDREIKIAGNAGTPDVSLLVFTPAGPTRIRPAIYHMHGGGMVLGKAVNMSERIREYVALNDVVVVSVEYRLAPETAFPGPIEDCYAGLVWLFANAPSLGVDPARIAVMGESAGGGLAAALALLARDRNTVRPCAQILVYPMLEHRTGGPDDPHPNEITGQFSWSRESNQYGWASMQGSYNLADDRIGHFSPSRASDLRDLPPAFIGVGALDLFMEEDVDYARRLVRRGVAVECHVYPGAIHGFDFMPSALERQFVADRTRAIGRLLRV